MSRILLICGLLATAGALNTMRVRQEPAAEAEDEDKDDFADSSDDGVQALADDNVTNPKIPDEDPDSKSTSSKVNPKYQRPFNLTNGACKTSDKERYVMEIENVAGGSYYVGKMGFGTPVQELNMLLDTGSDEIVVKGAGCDGCEGRGYDPKASSTYKKEAPREDPHHGREAISYGSGDVSGQRGYDTVTTGPLSGLGMQVMQVTKTSISEFQDTSSTALEVIAGMAPGLPEYVGEKLASHMEVRRFSECLPINSNENGFFVVNDGEPSGLGFSGPFTSMGNYYWAIAVTDFRFQFREGQEGFGTKMSKPLGKRMFSALADTGTTLMSLPQTVMDDIDDALEMINYDCNQMDKLPDLAFEIEGVTHTLPPNTYIALDSGHGDYARRKGVNDKRMNLKEGESSEAARYKNMYHKKQFMNKATGEKCALLFTEPLYANSTLGELGILGMPFFRNYIISFDFCSRQIWTKRSSQDCFRAVGQTPGNKKWCDDAHVIGCMFEEVANFFYDFVSGFASIFTTDRPPKSGPSLELHVGKERFSQAAHWLLKDQKNMKGTVVEV